MVKSFHKSNKMRIIEYRVIVPVSIEQYPKADTYMCNHRMEIGASEGECVELIDNNSYVGDEGPVFFASRVYHCKNRVPKFLQWLVPEYICDFQEDSWTYYPKCKSKYIVPFLGDKFNVSINTHQYKFTTVEEIPENGAGLTDEELAIREIKYVDILLKEPVPEKKEWDLDGFSYEEANIHKLETYDSTNFDDTKPPKWTKDYKGEMTVAIKVMKADIPIWGVQTMAEKLVVENMAISTFLDSARALVGWAPKWHPMTMKEVEKMNVDVGMAINEIYRTKYKKEETKAKDEEQAKVEEKEKKKFGFFGF